MARNKKDDKTPRGSSSIPPEVTAIDGTWDDDLEGPLEIVVDERGDASPYDRVTAVPDVPTEQYVARMMQIADAREPAEADPEPDPTPPDADEPDRPALFFGHAELTEEEREAALERPTSPDPLVFSDPINGPRRLEAAPPESRPALDLDDPAALPAREDSLFDLPRVSPPAGIPAAPPAAEDRPSSASSDPTVVEMKQRHAAGDFSGALAVAERLLQRDPEHDLARRMTELCQQALVRMYSGRLGSLEQRLRVSVAPDQIRWLSLDHRAGFLLSLVDGRSSVEEVLDASGMPRFEALRILVHLLDQRVVALQSPASE